MGALAYGLDEATDQMVSAAGYMLWPAEVFPGVAAIGMLMSVGKGGPGSMIEGAQSWLDGAAALERGRSQLDGLCTAFGPDAWYGDDRNRFDTQAQQLSEQLGNAATYANAVGAGLGGLSAPLVAYGPVCLSIGAVLLSEALTFEAAVASVVGNLGASETAYAAGCATAASCLVVMTGLIAGIAAVMSAAAAGLAIGTALDVNEQYDGGDASAKDNFIKAEVKGLGEVVENAEKFGIGLGGDALGGKAAGGLPERTLVEHIIKEEVKGSVAGKIGNLNQAGIDAVEGKGPGQVLKDLSGYGDEIDTVDDIFGGDEPPPNDHADTDTDTDTDTDYSLPPTPPPPPAVPPPVQPHLIPIPPAEGDYEVIPIGSDINGDAVKAVRPA